MKILGAPDPAGMLCRLGSYIDPRSALQAVRNYWVLAVALGADGRSWGIETCLPQLLAEAGMIVRLTTAIVVNRGTAAADSLREEDGQLVDCKTGRIGSVA